MHKLFLLISLFPMGLFANSLSPSVFLPLQQDLVTAGFDKTYVQSLFKDRRFQFMPKIVNKITYLKKEKPSDYHHFLGPKVVERGQHFLIEHADKLQTAETQFQVKKEVIVAILTVESNFGKSTGRFSVFNVYASLAVMDHPVVMRKYKLDPALKDRIHRKASWGRSELKALLTYARQNNLDPLDIKGSWAGALGYPQFLPSSILRFGVDGDQNGVVDLYTIDDTIFSVANYLHMAGFQMNDPVTWDKAVFSYNHSQAYTDMVLDLAKQY